MSINIKEKFLSGFVFGVGLSAALAIFVYFSIGYFINRAYTQAQEIASNIKDWNYSLESNKLKISDEKSRIDDEGIVVTGVLTNSDVVAWGSITIEIEIFDSSDNFVHECTDRLFSPVAAGATENFKISCGKAMSNAPEYSKYKLRIVSADNI
jgi:predicted small secreted protein